VFSFWFGRTGYVVYIVWVYSERGIFFAVGVKKVLTVGVYVCIMATMRCQRYGERRGVCKHERVCDGYAEVYGGVYIKGTGKDIASGAAGV